MIESVAALIKLSIAFFFAMFFFSTFKQLIHNKQKIQTTEIELKQSDNKYKSDCFQFKVFKQKLIK